MRTWESPGRWRRRGLAGVVGALLAAAVAAGCTPTGPDGSDGATGATGSTEQSRTEDEESSPSGGGGPVVEVTGGRPFVADGPAARAVLWAVGDGPDGDRDAAAVGRLVQRRPGDGLLYLGDVYEDRDEPDRLTDPTYEGSYAHLFRSTYGGAVVAKTAPTVGNHEWADAEGAPGYESFWSAARRTPTQYWYEFRAGGWEVLSLTSETDTDASSPQVRWLQDQLEEPGTCRLAFWHQPRFSAGRHGDQPDVDTFWRLLQGRAVLVLSGHDHNMQVMAPVGGLVQLVSGAGGRGHYRVDATDPRLVWSDDSSFGAVRLELSPGSARYSFVDVTGRVLHSDVVRCQPLER